MLNLTEKELKTARVGKSKDGAPGSDKITVRMRDEVGGDFDKFLLSLYNRMLEVEYPPPQFRETIEVPLYKRGSRHVAKSYRPVALVQTALKEFQSRLYQRVNSSEAGRKLTGPYNFGSVKGRDRHMLIWVVNEVCVEEMEEGGHGGHVLLAAWDADNAYPSLWQDGVDWLMWKAGIRGKFWRVLRNLERGLRGTIRINGHFIDTPVHEDGANQGAVSPPHRWKYLMAGWFDYCQKKVID